MSDKHKPSSSKEIVASDTKLESKEVAVIGGVAAVPALLWHAIPAWWAKGLITGLLSGGLAFVIAFVPWFAALLSAFVAANAAINGVVEGRDEKGRNKAVNFNTGGRVLFGITALASLKWIFLFGGWLSLLIGAGGTYFLRQNFLNGPTRLQIEED